MNGLNINQQRLLQSIKESSTIGATPNGGLHRLALSIDDKQMRNLLINWFEEEGLSIRVDDFGNMYGRREGKYQHQLPVVIGSHLDTQPCGGRFDGILGVLAALEVVRSLNEANVQTDRPIEIINFTNEEGARFEPPMLGSGGVCGVFEQDFIYSRQDKDGIKFHDALSSIGYKGLKENRLQKAEYFIELHIEQGPILEDEQVEIGVVEGIQGISWISITVEGEMNHAGPTPMENRKDAVVAAAKMIESIDKLAQEYEGLKTTVGQLNVYPNVPNVISGKVEFIVDIRHEEDEQRERALEVMKQQLSTISGLCNVELTFHTSWENDSVTFSEKVIKTISKCAEKRNLSTKRMFSGPGHDAKYMAEIAKTGMIFVPSHRGISHNEEEFTRDDDLVNGANLLLDVVCQLSEAKLPKTI